MDLYFILSFCILVAPANLFLFSDDMEQLSQICPDARKQCHLKKQDFHCSDAGCKSIPIDFISPDIKKLYLENNSISAIPQMDKFADLTHLFLAQNNISKLNERMLRAQTKLTDLDLSHNKIESIEASHVDGLESLIRLRLRYNRIQALEDDLFPISNLHNLEEIDLTGNQLKSSKVHQNAFTDLPNLKYLHLGRNRLDVIDHKYFLGLKKLQSLILHRNNFEKIGSHAFEPLSELRILDISYNLLKDLHTNSFRGLDNLETLHLEGNRLQTLASSVKMIPGLQTLFLDRNQLVSIEGASLPQSLVVLQASQMSTLTSIEKNAFVNMPQLETVRISNNMRLNTLHPSIFGQENSTVLYVDLSYNALTTLDPELLNWNKIRYLRLEHNLWSCDCRMRFMRHVNMPFVEHEPFASLRCSAPPLVSGMNFSSLRLEELECHSFFDSPHPHLMVFLIIILAITLVLVVIGLTWRCRTCILKPCRFPSSNSNYQALYNKNGGSDVTIYKDQESNQQEIKLPGNPMQSESTEPTPVAV